MTETRTINFACGCFLSYWVNEGVLREALACCEVHEQPNQTLEHILSTTHEIAIRARYIPRTIPSLEAQVVELREKFPDALIEPDGKGGHIVSFTVDLPIGVWNQVLVRAEFEARAGWPFAPPDGFYADGSLRFADGQPSWHITPMRLGVRDVVWFRGGPITWDPWTCSLLTYARIIRLVLWRNPGVAPYARQSSALPESPR